MKPRPLTPANPPLRSALPGLLAALSVPEWRHHPWRHAVALLAVALGVALAFAVHLINSSALEEFGAAVRAANGEPDLSLRCARREGCSDALFEPVALLPGVRVASAVVEIDSQALVEAGGAAQGDAAGAPRQALRVLGIDALSVAEVAPMLMPAPSLVPRTTAIDGAGAAASAPSPLDPQAIFLNPAAVKLLGASANGIVQLGSGLASTRFKIAGSVAAAGPPLAVVDIAAAQDRLGFSGRLSRIDLRLEAGFTTKDRAELDALLRDGWSVGAPDVAQARLSNVSRAYRVNLTVLALVALFVGAFLVFSVLALSVAQRTPAFALLGVLGLSARERQALVLAECALLGLAGSVFGLAAGTGLAALALQLLAGDLGGGFFPGIAPALAFSWPAAGLFGVLGVAAAMAGGWLPARQAAALAPAQALKGLGGTAMPALPRALPPALLGAGVLLALLPPVHGLPLAAYGAVALLLLGGIAAVPVMVDVVLAGLRPQASPLALLALQRARHERHAATIAVASVVASLSLAVALTVMVASFRAGVSQWLDTVLPADLYARTSLSSAASDSAYLPREIVALAAAVPGVRAAQGTRVRALVLDPAQPTVALLARPLGDPARTLPLIEAPPLPSLPPTRQSPSAPPLAAAPAGGDKQAPGSEIGVYVSEAVVALYGATPGSRLVLPIGRDARGVTVRVLGVWRDYARQFGAIAIDDAAYRALTGDERINDLALWLAPGANGEAVQRDVRALAQRLAAEGSAVDAEHSAVALDFAQAGQIRALSLRIFDRSFAVTYWLQAVAVGIGLFGIAASFSAQVLARRREFGLLVHLGLTRAQIVGVVAGEGAAWTAAGTLAGLLLGLAVALVLVHVVNPQSFHWTMDLVLPWGRLAALSVAVLVAGSATAALSARSAAAQDVVLAVKEDW